GMLTGVLGIGPALTATIFIPDRHHFRGSYSGKDIIPLWRDAEATEPNLTAGLVDKMEEAYGFSLKPEDILAYAYALLATPAYVERYSEELTIPGPRLPLTKNLDLFKRSVALGRRLIWLHTYGERMVPDGHAQGVVPQGQARNTVAVPEDREQYPEAFSYNEANKTLTVGSGAFAPVIKSVWEFSVSGLEVVRSWLRYRMKAGAGKKSSPLNDIRPEHWTFSEELLELLWVLEATVAMFPGLEANLEAIVASDLFTEGELPKPTEEEKKPPAVLRRSPGQVDLNLEE
ncbi:MAG: DNA methyltransferase, partial [SAR324 cluster bacterium]|nr:DNA methyltransferase [SAR324 cluster bacterium]